jgi:hypothetical protein
LSLCCSITSWAFSWVSDLSDILLVITMKQQ